MLVLNASVLLNFRLLEIRNSVTHRKHLYILLTGWSPQVVTLLFHEKLLITCVSHHKLVLHSLMIPCAELFPLTKLQISQKGLILTFTLRGHQRRRHRAELIVLSCLISVLISLVVEDLWLLTEAIIPILKA